MELVQITCLGIKEAIKFNDVLIFRISAEPNHIVKAIFNQLKRVVGITWFVVTALVIGQLKTHRVIDIRAFK